MKCQFESQFCGKTYEKKKKKKTNKKKKKKKNKKKQKKKKTKKTKTKQTKNIGFSSARFQFKASNLGLEFLPVFLLIYARMISVCHICNLFQYKKM